MVLCWMLAMAAVGQVVLWWMLVIATVGHVVLWRMLVMAAVGHVVLCWMLVIAAVGHMVLLWVLIELQTHVALGYVGPQHTGRSIITGVTYSLSTAHPQL